ncbi:MAG TPA: response regulator [Anaeromyxobacteraceae bacterium]|nr:response regulator [Anaeromyxobacteraceae bacterium]
MISPPAQAIPILVVEDESVVALDLAQALEVSGYSVAGIAASGAEAIRIARARRPALVLMDARLDGDMDGIDTARAIRELEDLPIVFLTAFGDDATIRRAAEAGAYAYLVKPYDEPSLRGTIQVALAKHAQARAARLEHSAGDGIAGRIVADVARQSSLLSMLREVCCEIGRPTARSAEARNRLRRTLESVEKALLGLCADAERAQHLSDALHLVAMGPALAPTNLGHVAGLVLQRCEPWLARQRGRVRASVEPCFAIGHEGLLLHVLAYLVMTAVAGVSRATEPPLVMLCVAREGSEHCTITVRPWRTGLAELDSGAQVARSLLPALRGELLLTQPDDGDATTLTIRLRSA